MLKQQVENKGSKVSDTVTVSGQVYRKADYEDSERPGYSRVGKLYTSAELHACGLWDLTSPSGHRFSAHLPVQRAADPSHVSRADAPAPLREAAAKAWAKLEEIRGRIAAALERRTKSEEAQLLAARHQIKGDYNRAVANAMKSEEERKALELEEPPLRQEVSRAEEAIRRWMVDESMYRTGAAERPAEPAIF